MKTNRQKYLVQSRNYLLLILFFIGMANCSKKDDTPSAPFITTEPTKLTSTNLNSCPTGSGNAGSKLHCIIPYKASSSIVITQVEYAVTSTTGVNANGQFSAGSDGTDGNFETSFCVRFDTNAWVEYTLTLVSSTGLKSNPSVIRFNKPAGAN